MKILIAADMEGISGVVHWDHVDPAHPEYARFRKIMTAEVNAGIRGALDGGADEIMVTDGHSLGRNLLIEDLDPRALLNSGMTAPLSMVRGVDRGVDGVIFIGYHARIGTQNAILDHTWSSRRIANVWINDQPFGEVGLNAAVSGHYNVPVIMISGDQSACGEASALLGSIETVVVKQAFGRMAAECLTPEVAQEKIQAGARQAVKKLARGETSLPLRIEAPITLKVEFMNSEMADNASILPGTQRSGRKLTFVAGDMLSIYTAFQAAVTLAD